MSEIEKIREAFFKGEISIDLMPLGIKEAIQVMYEPENFLYNIEDTGEVVRIPKGGWVIMDALVPHILKHVKGCVVEIGMGESTSILADHAYEAGRKLYSCDIEMGGMFNVFKKPLFDDHICYIGKSEDFIKEFDDVPAIVFIDGEHTYKTVKMEVEFFLPRLETHGVMFMHDTFPYQERLLEEDNKGRKAGTIYKVRQELERNPDVDVLTWPYTALNFGLTMVLKHKKNREYWLKNGRKVKWENLLKI